MRCYIGIDGGGTKTILRAVSENDQVICEVFGGSSNLCSNTEKQVETSLIKLWQDATKTQVLEPIAICLGTAGISKEGGIQLLSLILHRITGCSKISVIGDMQIPLEAETKNENCIVLIAGTGSICFGRTAEGKELRLGGYGHIIGDEGSGYWITKEALTAVARAADRRGEKTALTNRLLQAMECKDVLSMVSKLHSDTMNKSYLAGLSLYVEQVAIEGDKVALDIMQRAQQELLLLCCKAIDNLNGKDKPLKVIFVGGVITKAEGIKQYVKNGLYEYSSNITIIEFKKESVDGAIQIAKKL